MSGGRALWRCALGFTAGKRKSKTCFMCGKLYRVNKLYIKALDNNGDTVIMDYKPITDIKFRYRLFPGRCVKPLKWQCSNFLQVFGYRKSKFKITKKDFDIIILSTKHRAPDN